MYNKKIRFQSLKLLHFKVHRLWPYPQTQACQEQTLYQGFFEAYLLKRFCNIGPFRIHTKLERFLKNFSLDEEFEAGRSKLAKLRERIRRAKGVIKDADEALKNSS
jgi:hypothetical protein